MGTLRNRTIAAAVAACMAAAAVPAIADGPNDTRYNPLSWQGMYAGVFLGHGEAGPLDGFVGGGFLGRNWQQGKMVYGWEADVSIADISYEFLGLEASVDLMATVRGRVGYLFHPDYLAYATAGLGYAHVEVADHWFGGSISDSGTDFVIGFGVEGKLNQTSTVRVEYLNHGDLDIFRAGLTFKLGN